MKYKYIHELPEGTIFYNDYWKWKVIHKNNFEHFRLEIVESMDGRNNENVGIIRDYDNKTVYLTQRFNVILQGHQTPLWKVLNGE